ncbi:MAG TPA: TlyA family RNA methyltransferase [Candidatus Ozemobacteraceae bacterium]|nr:TlyA family RNA methyltransferase [Candidatus Ozemobacteraceae bacterium]HQG27290.1 TlyA family RNA methyltransferase [Candidatus Ozemobacteraceae bacterium]
MAKRMRVDLLVVHLGLAPDTDTARRLVMAGEIRIGDRVYDKPGELVPSGTLLERREKRGPFVSRGAVKLDNALSAFDIDVGGATCLDIGASTGGFTQVLLRRGAAHVTALDVGYGLLDARLRDDPRVTPVERTNFRTISEGEVSGPYDLIVADVSFISLRAIVAPAMRRLAPGGSMLLLVKPQFEAEAASVSPGGLVTDPDVHRAILAHLCAAFGEHGLLLFGLEPVPVVSANKNIEYISWWKTAGASPLTEADRDRIVAAAFARG